MALACRVIARRVRASYLAASVRSFAKKATAAAQDGGSAANLSPSEITRTFLEMDAAAGTGVTSDLPVKLTGRSGELVEQLYIATQKSKTFEKAVKELEGFVQAVQSNGLVIDRFFNTSNYSEEECKKVLDLLISNKEPLTSFDSIKDVDVKEVIVDNEGNLDAWRNARKAISALGLSAEVKTLMETLASEARLDLIKKAASKAADLRLVTAKRVEAVVASAVPLSKDQQAAVSKALPQYAPSGQTLNVSFVVDPAILGGLTISIQNQMIDLSVTSRLMEAAASQSQRLQ